MRSAWMDPFIDSIVYGYLSRSCSRNTWHLKDGINEVCTAVTYVTYE